jgi:polynucleotide 5'-hydroxyl-kinase GRC3/NOL9
MPDGAVLEISSTPNRVRILSAHDAEARPTVIPLSWQTAVQEIEDDWRNFLQRRTRESTLLYESTSLDDPLTTEHSSKQTYKVAFTGTKGVGKSTCLRYCLNRLLSNPELTPKVAVLDADVGQPELGPPGMLTLSIRTEPLLKHPYSHLLTKKRPEYVDACFYGSITSQTNPERYIHCVRYLLEAFHTLVDDQIPLLINLDGWVQGLGLEILQTLIHDVLRPWHVIQIERKLKPSELGTGKVEYILHSCLAFDSGALEKAVDIPTASDNESLPEAQVQNNPINCSDLVSGPSMSLPPSSLRNLRLLAYFLDTAEGEDPGEVWDSIGIGQNKQEGFLQDTHCEWAKRLASSLPYMVPFEMVHCTFASLEQQTDFERWSKVHPETAMESIMNLFNGSIVGLCTKSSEESRGSDFTACVGLGIVRSVDVGKGLFYILTPVDGDKLQSVHTLCLASGSITLPMEALFRGVVAESFPRISFEIGTSKLSILGADPMKSRNSIGRRSLQNNANASL